MKKLISVVGALAALMLVPVVAQATTSTTIHLNGGAIDVGPAGCVAGDLVIMGNGVLHQTINNAGDVWITGTVEGAVSATDPSSGYTGHAAAWFGLSRIRHSAHVCRREGARCFLRVADVQSLGREGTDFN